MVDWLNHIVFGSLVTTNQNTSVSWICGCVPWCVCVCSTQWVWSACFAYASAENPADVLLLFLSAWLKRGYQRTHRNDDDKHQRQAIVQVVYGSSCGHINVMCRTCLMDLLFDLQFWLFADCCTCVQIRGDVANRQFWHNEAQKQHGISTHALQSFVLCGFCSGTIWHIWQDNSTFHIKHMRSIQYKPSPPLPWVFLAVGHLSLLQS